jgi:hypothetical protein
MLRAKRRSNIYQCVTLTYIYKIIAVMNVETDIASIATSPKRTIYERQSLFNSNVEKNCSYHRIKNNSNNHKNQIKYTVLYDVPNL